MGFFDALFGSNQPQQITPQLPSVMDQADIDLIEMGQFPSIATNEIYLQKNEVCYYADNARLMNEKTVKDYMHKMTGGGGPLFLGLHVHYGKMQKIQTGEHIEREFFDGKLFVTNKRMIFLEKEQGLDKRHTSITAIKAYSNAIEIQYGSKTYNIFVPDGYLLNDLFELLH